ncbi:cystatin-like protein [Ictalurus punctatus]|uniref:Cystatin-like protein n=1 Tax=Ictalurus punctatus TaxID=7998 RepID=A0A2D0R8N8_ICTPU|nr:cystatin-like protein [Ictalurus punctatus]
MDGALKALLLAALILLVSAQTSDNYRSLNGLVRKHVDKALKKANQDFGTGYHIAFHSLITTPMTRESILNVNVLLKVTTCKKTSNDAYEHRDECNEQKEKTPVIDCLVCKTNDGNELVDCAKKIDVSNQKHTEIRGKCIDHLTGGSDILTRLSEDNKKQSRCLECV